MGNSGDGTNTGVTPTNTAGASNTNSTVDVSAISVKLPAFWPKLPVEWFLQVEALFATRGITSQQTKYDHVLSVLPSEIITTVLDVLQVNRATTTNPYDALKAALLGRLVKSESRRIEELLNGTPMGDRTPSEYYRHLRAVAGNSTSVNDNLLAKLWLRNLPALVQTAVTASGRTEPTEMTKVADEVYEVYERQTKFTPMSPAPGISELVAQNQKLLAEVAALKKSFSDMSASNRSRSRSRSRNREDRLHTSTSSGSTETNGLCWYHNKYGDAAKKCRKPCTKSITNNPN